MDAEREPGPLMQPAALLQIVERAATIHGLAKLGFVAGLGEVRNKRTPCASASSAVRRISDVDTLNGE